MEHPFEMWSDRIAAANTDDARRELLGEAKVFRARHLGDVASVRRATFAISRLHAMLEEREPAVHEAKQLLSLCQTAPVASSEELDAARGYLAGLGERVPTIVNPPKERSWRERPPREQRPARPERPGREARPAPEPRAQGGGLQAAREAASAGRWAEVVERVGRPASPPAAVLLAVAELSRLLDEGLDRDRVARLRDQLAGAAGLRATRAATPAGADPLSKLLGVTAPDKRAPRLRLIEEFAEKHPDRIDALAAAALRHHVQVVGARVPAPWLVGTVAKALATGNARETEAAIGELRAADAVAALAYDEWPFDRIVRLVTRAGERGQAVGGIRRGVLAGGNEPDERKVWTLRLRSDDGERMIAVAPHAGDAYPPGKAEEVAARLHELCPSTLLLATGSGNEGLRSAAAALGCRVMDRDADDDRVLASTLELPPAPAERPRRAEPEAEAPAAAAEPAPAAPRAPRIGDLLAAEPFDEAALREAVAGMKRPDRALRMVRGDLPDDRLAALLRAVAAASPADRPLPEGATMALRGGGPLARAALLETPQYAGPGVGVVADVAAALVREGWDLHRVLRGPTHRETERHPALETLASGLSGLWRLLVRHTAPGADRRGEVWVVAELPAEGRAGVPLLLLEDWQRVVVLPDDAGLADWWGTLGAVPAVRWTGDPAPLLAAAGAFEAREPRASDGAEGTDGAA